jgi:predicted Zn-dependent protease with MMP-like domain
MKQKKTIYDFDNEFEELMDQAVNDLSPKQFAKFLDDISMMLADYEDGQEGE